MALLHRAWLQAHGLQSGASAFAGTCGVCWSKCQLHAALCIFAANSDLNCRESPLTAAFMDISTSGANAVAKPWARWRGPVRLEALSRWAQELFRTGDSEKLMVAPQQQPAMMAEQTAAADTAFPTPKIHHVLSSLLARLPVDLCCALDGQLLIDPVQSPNGHIFERASLAAALTRSGSLCPLTGLPLTLAECRRVPDVRRAAIRWLRQHHPRPST